MLRLLYLTFIAFCEYNIYIKAKSDKDKGLKKKGMKNMDYGYYKKIAKDSLSDKWSTVAIGSLIYFAVYSICNIPSAVTSIYEMLTELGIDLPDFIDSVYIFYI